jgi:hypothetical protein
MGMRAAYPIVRKGNESAIGDTINPKASVGDMGAFTLGNEEIPTVRRPFDG